MRFCVTKKLRDFGQRHKRMEMSQNQRYFSEKRIICVGNGQSQFELESNASRPITNFIIFCFSDSF